MKLMKKDILQKNLFMKVRWQQLNTTTILSIIILVAITNLLSSCGEAVYTPKPRGYPRVVFPEHTYQVYKNTDCPFSFEQPKYATVIKDSLFFKEAPENPCWMDVVFPNFNAQLHLSYKEVKGGQKNLSKLIEDAHKLNAKHFIRADFSEDSLINTKNGVHGLFYEVGGNAASPNQFFVTDSTNHFIWASLYFKSPPNEDSLAPIVKFIRKDIDHLLNTFAWN